MYDAKALKNLLINENGFGFDPSTGHTYILSMSALELIRLLNNGADEDTLMQYLCDTYDVEKHRATSDLDSFIASLCQYGLLISRVESEEA